MTKHRAMLFLFAALAALLVAAQGHAQKCPAVDSEIKRDRLLLLAKQPDGLHKAALANCGSFETGTVLEDAAVLENVASSLEVLVLYLERPATQVRSCMVLAGRF